MSIRKLRHDEIVRTSVAHIEHAPRHPLYLIVDNVRSLYNVGSIFRSCDGAMVKRLFLCGFTPYPPRKEIDKTALGATESVPWEYVPRVTDAIGRLKAEGVRIAALEHTDKSMSCFDLTPDLFPLAVVVGNEIAGISQEAVELCDLAVEIPMHGVKHSLNVAVATGILLYECLRTLQVKND